MALPKMDLLTVFTYFLVVVLSVNAREHVPVLLWESPNPGGKEASATALSKMSTEEFSDVLTRRVDRSPIVVLFSEETISVEDFSRQNSGLHESFPAMKSITEETGLQFIPAVQSPGKALNRLSKLGYKWEEVTDEVLPEGGKKILVVRFDDPKPGEDRSDLLARHDKRIVALYRRMVEKYSDVLAIYTGEHPSWTAPDPSFSRSRREADTVNSASSRVLTANGAEKIMLYTSADPILITNNTAYNLSAGQAFPHDARKGSIRMTTKFKLGNGTDKINLKFRFIVSDDGFWRLTQAEYVDAQAQSVILEPKSSIMAAVGFSYSCGCETIFENATAGVSLKFKNLQVQPSVSGNAFGPATDCIPFFTIGIWSGLLVTFLLLFIVGWGIDMMMNIHTMDRFDDPKGKPLVFNAQE